MTKNVMSHQKYFSPFNMKPAEYLRNVFRQNLEVHFTREDLTDTAKWRQIAQANPSLKAGDIIEVLREDNLFFATLLVTGKVNDDLFVAILDFKILEEQDANESLAKESEYEAVWKGPTKKWTLTRKSDNKEIKDKFSSKDEAKFWFKNNY